MKRSVVYLILISICISACKKEDSTPQPQPSGPVPGNYTPLTIGSYWVYDWYQVDSSGNSTFMNKTDSMYISGDILIAGYTYAVLEKNFFGGITINQKYLRDSLGYLVSDQGVILFSSTNFTDTLRTLTESFYFSFWKMDEVGLVITVPSGTWPTFNYKQTVIQTNGTFACGSNIGYENSYYANNIGLVCETIFFFGSNICQYFEKKLVRYHIN
jgi:hypothetical protein